MYNDPTVFDINKERGVRVIVESGISPETNRIVIEESKIDIVYFTLGYHPTEIVKDSEEKIEKEIEFIKNINNEKFLGIGEIGLDFYWNKEYEERKKQEKWFRRFLELAEEIKKPVIIHAREAEEECYNIINSYNVVAIFHSFWKPELTSKVIEKYYISVPAFVYRNKELQEVVRRATLDRILTETDAPFLDPIDKRKNMSWKIKYGIKKISEIHNVSEEEVKEIVRKNFEKIFKCMP
jgi:TatD DNase family protein